MIVPAPNIYLPKTAVEATASSHPHSITKDRFAAALTGDGIGTAYSHMMKGVPSFHPDYPPIGICELNKFTEL